MGEEDLTAENGEDAEKSSVFSRLEIPRGHWSEAEQVEKEDVAV